jgi:hypothetical protein
MSEAEEVVAAEAPDARHRRFFVFVLFFSFFLPSQPQDLTPTPIWDSPIQLVSRFDFHES